MGVIQLSAREALTRRKTNKSKTKTKKKIIVGLDDWEAEQLI